MRHCVSREHPLGQALRSGCGRATQTKLTAPEEPRSFRPSNGRCVQTRDSAGKRPTSLDAGYSSRRRFYSYKFYLNTKSLEHTT